MTCDDWARYQRATGLSQAAVDLLALMGKGRLLVPYSDPDHPVWIEVYREGMAGIVPPDARKHEAVSGPAFRECLGRRYVSRMQREHLDFGGGCGLAGWAELALPGELGELYRLTQ